MLVHRKVKKLGPSNTVGILEAFTTNYFACLGYRVTRWLGRNSAQFPHKITQKGVHLSFQKITGHFTLFLATKTSKKSGHPAWVGHRLIVKIPRVFDTRWKLDAFKSSTEREQKQLSEHLIYPFWLIMGIAVNSQMLQSSTESGSSKQWLGVDKYCTDTNCRTLSRYLSDTALPIVGYCHTNCRTLSQQFSGIVSTIVGHCLTNSQTLFHQLYQYWSKRFWYWHLIRSLLSKP